MTYDNWKATNPADEFLGPEPNEDEEMATPCISSAAEKFAPSNFVTEGTTDKVGMTLSIEDPTEANPRVLVRWFGNGQYTDEWVRSEYLYLAI